MHRRHAALGAALLMVMAASAAQVVARGDTYGAEGDASSPGAASPAAGGATIALPDGWQPEGITSDGLDTLYVGSLANGAIWRGSASEGTGDVFIEGADGRVAVGVELEVAAGRLWVAGGDTGEVRAYDAATGEQLGAWQVATAGSTFLNDLVATPDAVHVTDSQAPELRVIPLGTDGSLPPADGWRSLPLSGDYAQVEGFNANGVVASGDQLIVVQSATGMLFRVDPATGEASAIDAGGYSFGNGDGLELADPGLFVVRNQLNMIALVTLDDALTTATLVGEIGSPDLDVPTTATWTQSGLFAVNARFGTEAGPETEYWITRLDAPMPMGSPAPVASPAA